MKGNQSQRLFITASSLILVITFFLLYLNSTIDLAKIDTNIKTSIRKIFPKSEITITTLNYNFGSSLEFLAKEISIEEKSKQASLSLKEVKLNMSYWTLISGEGQIYLKANGIEIYSQGDWKHLLNKTDSSASFQSLKLFEKSKIDFELKNINIHEQKKNTTFRKIKLKNFSLKNKTAFEIYLDHHKYKNYFGPIHMIGEIQLQDLLFKNHLMSSFSYTLNKVKLNSTFVELRGSGKTNSALNKIKLETDIKLGALLVASLNIELVDGSLILSNIISEVAIIDLMKKIDYTSNLTDFVTFNDPLVKVTGEVIINEESILNKLDFLTNKEVKLSLNSFQDASGIIKGQIRNNKLLFTSTLDYLGGKCDLLLKGSHLSKSLIIEKMEGEAICSDQNITRFDARKFMDWGAKQDVKVVDEKKLFSGDLKVSFKFNNLALDTNITTLTGTFYKKSQELGFHDLNLDFDKGNLRGRFEADGLKEISLFELKFNKMNSKVINMFYPPHINDLSGILNGNILLLQNKNKTKKLALDLSLKSGSTVALQISKLLNNYYSFDGPNRFQSNIDRDFNKLILKASNKNDDILINEFILLGLNKAYTLKLSGKIAKNSASKVVGELRYRKNKFPFKYSGLGLKLLPDNKTKKDEERK